MGKQNLLEYLLFPIVVFGLLGLLVFYYRVHDHILLHLHHLSLGERYLHFESISLVFLQISSFDLEFVSHRLSLKLLKHDIADPKRRQYLDQIAFFITQRCRQISDGDLMRAHRIGHREDHSLRGLPLECVKDFFSVILVILLVFFSQRWHQDVEECSRANIKHTDRLFLLIPVFELLIRVYSDLVCQADRSHYATEQ